MCGTLSSFKSAVNLRLLKALLDLFVSLFQFLFAVLLLAWYHGSRAILVYRGIHSPSSWSQVILIIIISLLPLLTVSRYCHYSLLIIIVINHCLSLLPSLTAYHYCHYPLLIIIVIAHCLSVLQLSTVYHYYHFPLLTIIAITHCLSLLPLLTAYQYYYCTLLSITVVMPCLPEPLDLNNIFSYSLNYKCCGWYNNWVDDKEFSVEPVHIRTFAQEGKKM